jgi:hypothetical protein
MSWQAMDAADHVPHSAVKDLEYRVLLKLANVAAQDGTRAWRNMHEVAVELGVSLRSVRRALSGLEAERLIVKGDQAHVSHISGNRRPAVYDLNMEKMLNWDTYHGIESTPLDGFTPGVTSGVTTLSTTPVQFGPGVTSGVTTVGHHKELIEQPTKTNKATYGSARERRCAGGHVEIADTRYCIYGDPVREMATS